MPDSKPHSMSVAEVAEMAYRHAKKAWWANAVSDDGQPLGDYPAQAFNEGLEELKAAFESLKEQLEVADRALRDFAEHGVRHDLNPTRKVPTPDGFWLTYLERIDRAVRDRARAALSNPAKEPE